MIALTVMALGRKLFPVIIFNGQLEGRIEDFREYMAKYDTHGHFTVQAKAWMNESVMLL